MKISLMDYGVGNIHSITKGLERAGADVSPVVDARRLLEADCIVFPGVGAFGPAVEALRPVLGPLRKRILDGVPALGVCLGMQVLFERSEESPGEGISAFSGEVVQLRGPRMPHMGWNEAVFCEDQLFKGIQSGARFYFANSYVCRPRDNVAVATTDYGDRFTSAVRKDRLCGVQFHPEKSGRDGLKVLENFVQLAEGAI